jgi:hypothetical protein
MTVGKDTWVFQINKTNKISINTDINNLGWLQILAKLWRDFRSLNDASHRIIIMPCCNIVHTAQCCYVPCHYAECCGVKHNKYCWKLLIKILKQNSAINEVCKSLIKMWWDHQNFISRKNKLFYSLIYFFFFLLIWTSHRRCEGPIQIFFLPAV